MKKVLLSVAAFGLMTAGYAQTLLTYGFEEGEKLPGEIVAENWDNADHGSVYPNCNFDWASTDAPHTGARALAVHIDEADGTNDCGTWQRVIALTNTGFGENKSYRVSFYAKGEGKINVALLKGCFDHDVAPYSQTSTQTISGDYKKYSHIFWSPSRAVMEGQKSDLAQDLYWNQDFLRLAFISVGDYNVDDIVIEESVVESVIFNGAVLAIQYAYPTNIPSLSGGKSVAVEGVEATVKAGEKTMPVKAAEVHKDGKLYLFLEEGAELSSKDVVTVSIANAGPIVFSNGGSYDFADGAKPATTFAAEAATYDSGLSESAFADAEPVLLSANPSNGSFEIDPLTKQFSFTFDHSIDVIDEKPIATLDGIELTLVSKEASKTVVFERTSSDELFKGIHTLVIKNVYTDLEEGTGFWNRNKSATILFEVGEVQVATVTYTDILSVWMEGDYGTAQPTNGWISYFDGAENTTDANRVGNITTPDMGVGFYFCQRDKSVAAQLTYGEKEEAPLTLPAADNLQLNLYITKWDGKGGTIKYYLIKKAEVLTDTVASGTAASVDNTTGFGTTLAGITPATVKLPSIAAGNYVLSLEAADGWNGTIVYGFKVQSYTMSEGDVATSEVYFADSLALYGGNMPAEGSGYFCYNDNNRLAPGSRRDGTSGLLVLNNGGMTTAFFSRECGANYPTPAHYLTYGEEEAGKEFILPAGTYDLSYKCATWNDADANANGTSKCYLQILDATTREVVFESEHVNSTAANFKNSAGTEGVKADVVKESLTINQEGKYILRAFGSKNTVIGNIVIEIPGSKAVKYHTQLNEYLAAAKAELETSADVAYDGTTKSALITAVEKYSKVPNGMHTAEEYDAACKELEDLTEALATRRSTISKYDQVKANIDAYLNGETAIPAKYEALAVYTTLVETYATYKDITAQQLEDAELISATNILTNALNGTKYMVETGVPALTAQLTALSTQLVALDDTMGEDEYVIAAGDEISDNQGLADVLKLKLLKALYNKLATDDKFFVEIDDETLSESPKTFDATCFLQNPLVYTNAPAHDNCKIANFPGWYSDRPDFGMRPNYGWGGWDADPSHSIQNNNMFIGIGWVGDEGVNVWNNATFLPVGIYNLTIATMDRSGAGDWKDGANTWPNPERQLSYIFYQQGDNEPVTKEFAVEDLGQYYGFTDDTMEEVSLVGEAYADAKIGAYIHAQESFAAIRNVRLTLVAKADFDYAGAIEALDNALTGIENVVVREDAPVSARFFNLAGQEITEAEGVCVKIETYADGYMVIKKVVKK